MTPDATPLDQWLSDATEGLSEESAAQVRAEIQQHYDLAHEDSACEAGDDALAALGDPRAANRAYRKVLLTKWEARMAPSLTQPKRPSLAGMLLTTALWAAFVWWHAPTYYDPGFWPIQIAIFCTLPLRSLLPLTTIERIRIYLLIQGLLSILVVAIAGWYEGWMPGLAAGAVVFGVDCLFSRISLIFCKLGLHA